MAVLIGMSGDYKGKTFSLGEENFTLGRNSDNAISINNPAVSGKHCVIESKDGHHQLRDLGSTNGTHLNNKQVTEAILKPRDLILVGNVEFLFNSEEISFAEAEKIYSNTAVIEAAGPVVKPESFNSISPFGARQGGDQSIWNVILWIAGAAAIAAVGFFLYTVVSL